MNKTGFVGTSPVDFSDIEAVREFATSKDGTKIPLNILRRKGTKLDGQQPRRWLYGYGGYSVSMTPNFAFSRRLWFDRGGVYVVANLRGGRRVRRGVARGGQPYAQTKRVRRFRCQRGIPHQGRLHKSG